MLETAYYQKNKKSIDFSEQNLVDCVVRSNGCRGGSPVSASKYVQQTGITIESKYKYTGKDGSCKNPRNTHKIKSYKFKMIKSNEELIGEVLKSNVSSMLFVTANFKRYKKGIFSDNTCPEGKVNHAINTIGFDTDKKFWTIVNSWGTRWGNKGFMDIKMVGKKGGICAHTKYSVVTSF